MLGRIPCDSRSSLSLFSPGRSKTMHERMELPETFGKLLQWVTGSNKILTRWGVPRRFSVKKSKTKPACQCRRHRFNTWVKKIPWRRKWQPTPVFLHGKSHWQRGLVDYSPWTGKRVRHKTVTKQQQLTKRSWCLVRSKWSRRKWW